MSNQPSALVCSSSETSVVEAIAKGFVAGIPPVFCSKALSLRNWIAAAFEDELLLAEAHLIAQAAINHGLSSMFGYELPWNKGERDVFAYRANISAEALVYSSRNLYLGSCYFIVEKSSKFALTSSGDNYWMIAGPKDFVEEAIGSSVEEQQNRFSNLVNEYEGTQSLAADRLRLVYSVVEKSF